LGIEEGDAAQAAIRLEILGILEVERLAPDGEGLGYKGKPTDQYDMIKPDGTPDSDVL
jgi:hypothetical protein